MTPVRPHIPTFTPDSDVAVSRTQSNLSARDSFGRAVLLASLLVLALLPIDLLQYKILGWSAIVPLKYWVLHFDLGNSDSWMPMREALTYARGSGSGSLYQEIFFDRHVKFQYPPTALLPMLGLDTLGFDATNEFLNNINRALVFLNAVGVGWLFRLVLMRLHGQEVARSRTGTIGAILAGIATLLFYPVMMAFWLGQIQIWIDAGFTIACIAILSNRKLAAGAVVGLICLLKPQFGAFALWALLRREWRFTLGAAITVIPCGLLSLLLFGLTAHLDYLQELSFLSQRGEAMIANNSANGILNALLGTSNTLVWDEHGFPPYNRIVHMGTMLAAAILIVAAVWPRQRQGVLDGMMDFQFAALAFTMSAPIAWEHHYGIMAPILATLFCILAATPDNARRRPQLISLGVVFLLSALCVTSNRYPAPTSLNLAFGYLFVAGFGVLAMLWWMAPVSRTKTTVRQRIESEPLRNSPVSLS
jgi:alpha-1,2-mannosyltransferase